MKFHRIADLFPLMSGDELETLANDIKQNGQLHWIIVDKTTDLLVDGRNRWLACERAGVAPKIERREFADEAAIIRFVASENIHRRHLTTDQRASIAAEMANITHGSNRFETKVETSNDVSTIPISEAATLMNVSPASVDRAKRRMREDPEAHTAAMAGEKKPRTKRSSEKQKALDEIGRRKATGGDLSTGAIFKDTGISAPVIRAAQDIHELEAELIQLRPLQDEVAKLRVLAGTLRDGDRVHDALRELEKLMRQVPSGDPSRVPIMEALEYTKALEARVQNGMLQLNKKLTKITELRLRVKLEAMTPERGASAGEHIASLTAMKRLETAADTAEKTTYTLPRTREELLARRKAPRT